MNIKNFLIRKLGGITQEDLKDILALQRAKFKARKTTDLALQRQKGGSNEWVERRKSDNRFIAWKILF